MPNLRGTIQRTPALEKLESIIRGIVPHPLPTFTIPTHQYSLVRFSCQPLSLPAVGLQNHPQDARDGYRRLEIPNVVFRNQDRDRLAAPKTGLPINFPYFRFEYLTLIYLSTCFHRFCFLLCVFWLPFLVNLNLQFNGIYASCACIIDPAGTCVRV